MKPTKSYNKSDEQKEKNQKRRKPIIDKLLELESHDKIELKPFLEKAFDLKGGKSFAQWIKEDMVKNIWTEEYSKYTQSQKTKLAKIMGIPLRSQMDQTNLETNTMEGKPASPRGFAAAAAAPAKNANPDELRLTFASPDTVVFSDAVVKQVVAPTLASTVGVLANHVPTVGVPKPGVVSVTTTEGSVQLLSVSSGSHSVNIDGSCPVLSEEVLKIENIDESAARAELESEEREKAGKATTTSMSRFDFLMNVIRLMKSIIPSTSTKLENLVKKASKRRDSLSHLVQISPQTLHLVTEILTWELQKAIQESFKEMPKRMEPFNVQVLITHCLNFFDDLGFPTNTADLEFLKERDNTDDGHRKYRFKLLEFAFDFIINTF